MAAAQGQTAFLGRTTATLLVLDMSEGQRIEANNASEEEEEENDTNRFEPCRSVAGPDDVDYSKRGLTEDETEVDVASEADEPAGPMSSREKKQSRGRVVPYQDALANPMESAARSSTFSHQRGLQAQEESSDAVIQPDLQPRNPEDQGERIRHPHSHQNATAEPSGTHLPWTQPQHNSGNIGPAGQSRHAASQSPAVAQMNGTWLYDHVPQSGNHTLMIQPAHGKALSGPEQIPHQSHSSARSSAPPPPMAIREHREKSSRLPWKKNRKDQWLQETQQNQIMDFMKDYRIATDVHASPIQTLLEWIRVRIMEHEDLKREYERSRLLWTEKLNKADAKSTSYRVQLNDERMQTQAAMKEYMLSQQQLRERDKQLSRAKETNETLTTSCSERASQLTHANEVIAVLHTQLDTTERKLKETEEAVSVWDAAFKEQKSYYDEGITELKSRLVEANAKVTRVESRLRKTKEPAAYEATPDQIFRKAFQNLSQSINNLAVSVEKPDDPFSVSADLTGYLERNWGRSGDDAWRCFVHALCFNTLCEGFFHWPFGFGVFGKDGQKRGKMRTVWQMSLPRCNLRMWGTCRANR